MAAEQAAQAQQVPVRPPPGEINAATQPPPLQLSMREGGMLNVEGDPGAVRQWLEDAGIPRSAIRDGPRGVIVTAGSVERARQALAMPAPLPAGHAPLRVLPGGISGDQGVPQQGRLPATAQPVPVAMKMLNADSRGKSDPLEIIARLRAGGATKVLWREDGVLVPVNEAGHAQKVLDALHHNLGPTEAGTVAAPRLVLDLFGGARSQIEGAINVDIRAEEGIRASIFRLPIQPGIADEVIASSPYIEGGKGIMDWLPHAAKIMKPGAQIIINGSLNNKYTRLPGVDILEGMGLRVVKDAGPLLDRFKYMEFNLTTGGTINTVRIKSSILERVE